MEQTALTSPSGASRPDRGTDTTYRIRVTGTLGEEWSARTQGMTIAVFRPEGRASFTELTGSLPDQAALMGVLGALYDRGVRLVSVECTE